MPGPDADGRAQLAAPPPAERLTINPPRFRPAPELHASRSPAIVVAPGHRLLLAALLAFIVVVEERALGAADLAAAVAIGLEAVLADQRADPRRFLLDRIERVDAGHLGVELGPGIAVEQRQRTLRAGIPVAVGSTGQAADAAQFGLHRFGDLGLRRSGAERREVHGLVLVGAAPWRCLVRAAYRGGLVGNLSAALFSRGALLLGRGRLILRDLLGLFGRDARLLGGLGIGRRPWPAASSGRPRRQAAPAPVRSARAFSVAATRASSAAILSS